MSHELSHISRTYKLTDGEEVAARREMTPEQFAIAQREAAADTDSNWYWTPTTFINNDEKTREIIRLMSSRFPMRHPGVTESWSKAIAAVLAGEESA